MPEVKTINEKSNKLNIESYNHYLAAMPDDDLAIPCLYNSKEDQYEIKSFKTKDSNNTFLRVANFSR